MVWWSGAGRLRPATRKSLRSGPEGMSGLGLCGGEVVGSVGGEDEAVQAVENDAGRRGKCWPLRFLANRRILRRVSIAGRFWWLRNESEKRNEWAVWHIRC